MSFALKHFLIVALFLTTSTPAWALVRVAFLRVYDQRGNPVMLEPGGFGFYHVAIEYQGKWLHAHPRGGVQLSQDLSHLGQIDLILENASEPEPSTLEVARYLGKPYDYDFSWANDDAIYCSELVAKLLNLPIRPMRFEGQFWDLFFQARGVTVRPTGLGTSPDQIVTDLIARGYGPRGLSIECEALL